MFRWAIEEYSVDHGGKGASDVSAKLSCRNRRAKRLLWLKASDWPKVSLLPNSDFSRSLQYATRNGDELHVK